MNDHPAALDSATAGNGALPTTRVPGTRRWRINRRLGLATLAALLILAPSVFGWHAFQFRRNAAAILARAAVLNDQEDWQRAASCVYQYLQLRPGDPQALLLAAQCRDKAAIAPEDRQRAVSMYIQAVRVNPGDTPARKRLAELLFETDRLDEAAQQAQQVVAELPDDVESVRILARVQRAQLGQSRKSSATDVVEFHRQALTKHPGDIVLSTGLADVLRRFHDSLPAELGDASPAAADEVIDDMVARRPSDAETLLARYRYRAAWQLPGASDDLEQARLAAPDNPDVLLACVAATRNGDFAAAREVAERLLEVAPHNRRACFAVAACYSRLNQWDEALRVLEEAGERLGRDDLELNRALLQIYLSQQESERAEVVLAHLEPLFHRLEPQLAPPVRRRFAEELEFARAQLLCLTGKPAAALPALKRLAANVTESADAAENVAERQRRWKLLAAVYSHLGMHDRAANAFDSLVRLDPRSRENQLLAAAEWQRIGDFERAARHFESAATGESELPAAWLGLAETRLRQQLQKSPASSRDWSGYDAALKQLESRHADLPAVVMLKASAALARNDRTGALRDLKKLAAQSRLESAHLPRLAILFQDAGSPADADAALERFHRAGGNAEYAALAESELQRRRGDFDAALHTLEQAIDRAPASGRGALLRQLVAAEIDSGAIQSARRRLKGLRQSKFPDLWAYETAADLAVVAGDADDLLVCAQQIESLEGADGTMWRFVKSIQLLESEKEGNDAIHQANRWAAEIETSRPAWAQLQTLRGRIADRLGRTAEAAESYEQALRSGARSLATCQWLVSALQRLNRSADAAGFVGQSNQIAALSDELSAEAIPASLRTGHTDAALRIARTAAELRPADTAAQVWYAQTLALTGKADQAESLLRKVLEHAPQETRAWSALVWVLHRANRTAEARRRRPHRRAELPSGARRSRERQSPAPGSRTVLPAVRSRPGAGSVPAGAGRQSQVGRGAPDGRLAARHSRDRCRVGPRSGCSQRARLVHEPRRPSAAGDDPARTRRHKEYPEGRQPARRPRRSQRSGPARRSPAAGAGLRAAQPAHRRPPPVRRGREEQ
ncbi:MAG: tetratricopeptide repeat protein [Planctomycetia bacterium]|nr:tetratricopeptide repeat protein [Planctomycetia bacterium]